MGGRLRDACSVLLPVVAALACGPPQDAAHIASSPRTAGTSTSSIGVEPEATAPRLWRPSPQRLLDSEAEPPFPFAEALTLLPSDGGDGLLRLGWSATEEIQGRPSAWSSQPRSSVSFPLERRTGARIRLRCVPFAWAGAPPQSIELGLNGRSLTTLSLRSTIGDYTVDVAPEFLRAGSNLLELRYAWTAAPVDVVPGSRDERTLAVRFEQLRIELPAPEPQLARLALPDGSVTRALVVDRPEASSYLVLLPRTPALKLGGALLPQGETEALARVRVELESDEGSEVLLEAHPTTGAPEHWELDLGAWSGRPVRLRLRVATLSPGARFAWIEPEILSEARESPGEGRRKQRWNLAVVVLDAASPRRFGAYGHAAKTTPEFDALARESVVFENAWSTAAYTLASTVSLFTSRLPAHHGVVEKSDRLAPELVTLAEVVGDAGYDAAAFSANGFVSREFGMEQGFETFEELFLDHPGDPVHGQEIVTAVGRWLESRGRDRPFFLYLHFLQPHEPYGLAPSHFYRGLDEEYDGEVDGSFDSMRRIFRGEYQPEANEVERLRRLYDGNLRYADHAMGRLRDLLADHDLLERTILVVTSDHGEALGERGRFGHNWMVDPEVIDIPLLIRLPASLGLRGRVRDPVDTRDLAPTLLSAVGLTPPAGFEGRDLLPLVLQQEAGQPRVRLARSAHRHPVVGVEIPGYRYVSDPNTGRVSLAAAGREIAPAELARHSPVTTAFLAMAAARLGTPVPGLAERRSRPLDAPTSEALRALGYLVD